MNNNLNGNNLKLVDVNAEMALIGCLIDEPNIFDDLVSVCPKPIDLLTDSKCIDFMLAFSVLHHKGEKVIDSVSVNSYLQKKVRLTLSCSVMNAPKDAQAQLTGNITSPSFKT